MRQGELLVSVFLSLDQAGARSRAQLGGSWTEHRWERGSFSGARGSVGTVPIKAGEEHGSVTTSHAFLWKLQDFSWSEGSLGNVAFFSVPLLLYCSSRNPSHLKKLSFSFLILFLFSFVFFINAFRCSFRTLENTAALSCW